MVRGRDFFVLADDWSGLPTATAHLFRQLAPQNRIFAVNLLTRLPRPTRGDARAVGRTVQRWFRPSSARAAPATTGPAREQNVWATTAVTIPWFTPAVRRLNCTSLGHHFRRVQRTHGLQDPIVFTTLPCAADFVARVKHHPKIYFCLDDWAHYPGLDNRAFARMEADLIASVDGFAATSRALLTKGAGRQASLYLPHGVDLEHFHRPDRAYVPVAALEQLPRPIVGFFGLLAEWVDLELIAAASRRFPQVSFVLLGKPAVGLQMLAGRSNVHHLGVVPYRELPDYARYFDVGIIPFVADRLTQAVNPLKLLEYFALGLPVVATGLPELRDAAGPVFVAAGEDQFCDRLAEVLRQPRAHAAEAVAVARRNTWAQRAELLSEFLEQLG